MPICSLDRILQHASANRYAVGAFVSMNIEIIQAAIAAAEKEGCAGRHPHSSRLAADHAVRYAGARR